MFTQRDRSRLTESRQKQPWPRDKLFKILSLDGGGIRGIFSAGALKNIGERLTTGSRVDEYFDLIAGTSTGGIIAIGLGLGVPPSQIYNLYDTDGKIIFPPALTRWRGLRFGRRVGSSLYNQSAIESLLRREFSDRKLGDSAARLLIPSVVGPTPQIAVLKTDHHPDYRRDWKMPAWEAARATSAAPTYLPGHRFGGDYFLDGGLFANNPIMLAIVEAMHAYDVSLQQIRVLSIGTGNAAPKLNQAMIRAGLFGWRNIVSTTMYFSTDTALSQARLLLGFDRVVRLEPSRAGAEIELDDWKGAREVLPMEASSTIDENWEALSGFFGDKVSPRERHYSDPSG